MTISKTLCVNPFYTINPAGEIYSLRRKKFLKPTPHKGGSQVTIRNFDTGENEKFLVGRLKKFHFGNHAFIKFSDMSWVNSKLI
jgi:hypothetical protein